MSGRPGEKEKELPKGWSKGFSRSQKRDYFCHIESKHTQWHFPTAEDIADPLGAKQRAKDATLSSGKRATKRAKSEASASSASATSHAKDAKDAKDAAHSDATRPTKRPKTEGTSVAIIVPYRDIHPAQNRAAHLSQFIPYMQKFLRNQLQKGLLVDYHIYIIEQSDDGRKFNRGKLLNIGFDLARKGTSRSPTMSRRVPHNVFVFHDVDLLPSDALGPEYATFPQRPLHIARLWGRYSNNPKYFGGIVSFSAEDMRRINGYPNTFWGWGGEDDEMQNRCEKAGITWDKPDEAVVRKRAESGGRRGANVELIRDLEQMDLKEKLAFLRKNRSWKCMVKWEALEEHEKTWMTNGLRDLSYKVIQKVDLDKDPKKKSSNSEAATVTQHASRATRVIVDVQINGDHWANAKCHMDYMGG